MECFLIISYYILFVIDKFSFRTICFQTIFFYIFCYLYNKQLYTCNSYGTCRYDPFQQRLVNLHRILASKDHSNAMAYDNHCQHHSHMIHGICIGKIPCRRWNRNKNRIKQRHSTAVCGGNPIRVRRGITSTGPPAPDAAHTAPVTAPKSRYPIHRLLLFPVFLRRAVFSLDSFLRRMEIPDSKTTTYRMILIISSGIRRLIRTPARAPAKLPMDKTAAAATSSFPFL